MEILNFSHHFDFSACHDKGQNPTYSKPDLLDLLQTLISSTPVGQKLTQELDFFIKNDQIEFGNFANFKGRLSYKSDNFLNAKIQLDNAHSPKVLAAILVHELRHFKDFKQASSADYQPISVFATEINAFRDTYLFFEQMNMLHTKSYQELPEMLRKLLSKAYKFKPSSPLQDIEYMSFLLTQIGYDRSVQQVRVFPQNHSPKAPSATTSDLIKQRSLLKH